MPSASAALVNAKKAMEDRYLFDPLIRYTLIENFEKLPQDSAHVYPTDGTLATTTQAELLAYTRSHKGWLLGGTNIATNFATACIFGSPGGITLSSLTTASDQVIISPLLLNSVQQSAWGGTGWSPAKQLVFRTVFSLSSPTLTDLLIHIKLALTAVLDTSTDNDQVGCRFDSATNSTGALIPFTSIAGTDADITPDWSFVPVSGTHYELSIELDAGRVPTFFINRQRWARGTTALSATVSGGYGPSGVGFGPVIGCQCVTSQASLINIRQVMLSRTLA